mmetsp:Transcript_29113/g.65154  ORF Transcript_29113/g.65154 Transcript_29113/m.65154 type:complete len:292 (+) Transcript_29113:78-953(+)
MGMRYKQQIGAITHKIKCLGCNSIPFPQNENDDCNQLPYNRVPAYIFLFPARVYLNHVNRNVVWCQSPVQSPLFGRGRYLNCRARRVFALAHHIRNVFIRHDVPNSVRCQNQPVSVSGLEEPQLGLGKDRLGPERVPYGPGDHQGHARRLVVQHLRAHHAGLVAHPPRKHCLPLPPRRVFFGGLNLEHAFALPREVRAVVLGQRHRTVTDVQTAAAAVFWDQDGARVAHPGRGDLPRERPRASGEHQSGGRGADSVRREPGQRGGLRPRERVAQHRGGALSKESGGGGALG